MSQLSIFRTIRQDGDEDDNTNHQDIIPQEPLEDIYAYDVFHPSELSEIICRDCVGDESKMERYKNYISNYFDKEEDSRPYLEALEKK